MDFFSKFLTPLFKVQKAVSLASYKKCFTILLFIVSSYVGRFRLSDCMLRYIHAAIIQADFYMDGNDNLYNCFHTGIWI